jgi:DNA/RNA-binding domain of Phe-tRNA-synthetase-like protein
MFQVSAAWKAAYPQAHAGVLVLRDVINPPRHTGLDEQKSRLEKQLRARFAGQERADIVQQPVMQAYNAYYRGFKKTYHVQLQLESILFRGTAIPRVAALVEAMFMAEMDNLLLTAGHDLDALQLPVSLDVAQEGERYTALRGLEQETKAGDMLMRDGAGIISSILYGPNQRTQISARTKNVIFTVYAPEGIDEPTILEHLLAIQKNVLMIAPRARVEMLKVFGAQD